MINKDFFVSTESDKTFGGLFSGVRLWRKEEDVDASVERIELGRTDEPAEPPVEEGNQQARSGLGHNAIAMFLSSAVFDEAAAAF